MFLHHFSLFLSFLLYLCHKQGRKRTPWCRFPAFFVGPARISTTEAEKQSLLPFFLSLVSKKRQAGKDLPQPVPPLRTVRSARLSSTSWLNFHKKNICPAFHGKAIASPTPRRGGTRGCARFFASATMICAFPMGLERAEKCNFADSPAQHAGLEQA